MVFPTNPLDYIGYFGPAIIFSFVVINIYKQQALMIAYVILAFMNMKLNHFIKNTIEESRPTGEKHVFPEADRKGARKFGMPSGHAQGVSFNSVFLMLAKPSFFNTLFCVTVWGITLWQRWAYKNHTWSQLIAGSVVGSLVAFVSYHTVQSILKSRKM